MLKNKVIIEIDENGYYVEDAVIDLSNPKYPKFFTDEPLPTDDLGRQLPFYKPRWDGYKWVETLTQDEIDELKKQKNVEYNTDDNEKIALAMAIVDLETRISDLENN